MKNNSNLRTITTSSLFICFLFSCSSEFEKTPKCTDTNVQPLVKKLIVKDLIQNHIQYY